MNFKSPLWRPIAIGLTLLNLVWVPVAAAAAETWHAGAHAVLALAFGAWALRRRPDRVDTDGQDRLEELEADLLRLRQEVSETQERLDFAERLLAREREPHSG